MSLPRSEWGPVGDIRTCFQLKVKAHGERSVQNSMTRAISPTGGLRCTYVYKISIGIGIVGIGIDIIT